MTNIPPKRLSTIQEHEYFHPDVFLRKHHIKLNGETITDVHTYDQVEGWLERYVADENGNYIIDNDELVTERLRGVISVSYIY